MLMVVLTRELGELLILRISVTSRRRARSFLLFRLVEMRSEGIFDGTYETCSRFLSLLSRCHVFHEWTEFWCFRRSLCFVSLNCDHILYDIVSYIELFHPEIFCLASLALNSCLASLPFTTAQNSISALSFERRQMACFDQECGDGASLGVRCRDETGDHDL